MSENTVPVLVLYLLLLIPQASPLSFDVNPITNSNITLFNLKGDASIDDQGIQIPPNNQSAASRMGRATFKEPLHLWDTETGKLSDFSTHFSFIINSNGSDSFADGLAFFLAPPDKTLQGWCGAACFGLGDISSSPSLSSSESFVAVKFDTFMNTFDPFYDNSSWSTFTAVGININNMTTVNASRMGPKSSPKSSPVIQKYERSVRSPEAHQPRSDVHHVGRGPTGSCSVIPRQPSYPNPGI